MKTKSETIYGVVEHQTGGIPAVIGWHKYRYQADRQMVALWGVSYPTGPVSFHITTLIGWEKEASCRS